MSFLVSCMILLAVATLVLLSGVKLASVLLAYPYVKQASLFSPAERHFLAVLEQAVGANFRIQAKVRVADVLGVVPGLRPSQHVAALSKINTRHFDFVLLDANSFAVVAAIKLDDSRHPLKSMGDEFLGTVCASAQLPFIRMPASDSYQVSEVRRHILHTLFPPVIVTDAVDARMAMVATK